MTAIDDRVADAAIGAQVRDFYEQHPYPPAIDDLTGYAGAWNDKRRHAEAHLLWPAEAYRDDRSILVAGCGTSQAAKYALRWPKAQVTGIDFSKSSIDDTARLKRKHRIRNLQLHQLPLERAGELKRKFDYIVCTGVLHHLADPGAGLCALRNVLDRNGAMHLMVYAPYGRVGIYMLQDYCRRLGIGNSPAEVRDLAASLRDLPPDHPLVPLLRNAPDFANEAGLADALLNPRDRSYSVPELLDLLSSANLDFGRWLRQAPYFPACGALVQSPHRERFKRLAPTEQYAAVELFRAMAVHSLVAYRTDREHSLSINFEGDCWLDYVPVRVPDTVIVKEQLPPVASAVLINRNHSYRDIYLPIDTRQEALFETIDGKKSIRHLAPTEELRPVARVLFERLWQYDHVVFDTSKLSARITERHPSLRPDPS